MIAVDTSALIAILAREAEADTFLALLLKSPAVISSASRLEAYAVCMRRYGLDGAFNVERLLETLELETSPFDHDQLNLAQEAYRRFGRGGDRPVLNFGDCFAYALAKSRGLPLLFKGDDFRRTDIKAAL